MRAKSILVGIAALALIATDAVSGFAFASSAQEQPATHAESFPAWDKFTDELRQQGMRMMAKLPERLRNDPQVQQEAGRLLLEALAARTLDAISADGDHPVFLPWINVTLNVFQPNADTVYRKAILTPGGKYRIRGERGSLRIFKLGQFDRLTEETGTNPGGALAYDDFNQLHVDKNGRFDVLLSPARPEGYAGDWWRLDPKTNAVWIRQVAYDWAKERDPRISIERLDIPVARPRPSAGNLEQRLNHLAATVGNTAAFFVDHVETLRRDGYINRLKVFDLSQLAGLVGQFYYEGAYEIAPSEALIVEAKVPQKCTYWSIILTDDIYETTDWYNNQTGLNGAQARIDRDGIVRFVVSAKDPEVPNWLDPAGYQSGAIQGRWTECSETPIPTVRKVALSDVRKLLPADTPLISPAQREQAIRERRALAQQRPLW